MPGTTTILLFGGAFQDPSGNPVANGYLRMWLSHDSQEATTPGQVAGSIYVQIPLDQTGNIVTTSALVWPNSLLTPSSSYYNVELYSSAGMMIWNAPQRWTIPNTNPYNVGNLVPNVP
jgi:hypothetical protein